MRSGVTGNDLASSFEALWAPVQGLEVVDDPQLVRRVTEPESEDDADEHDDDDGNDGIDAEEGGEEEHTMEDKEGLTGEVSGAEGEEDD